MASTGAAPGFNRRFPTTSWTLLVRAGQDSTDARDALARLCQSYWPPVYAFIRHRGYSSQDAEDLTQEFFAKVLDDGYFQDAHRERGRFRSFLLACVGHFLWNERDRAQTEKRGGRKSDQPGCGDHTGSEARPGGRPYPGARVRGRVGGGLLRSALEIVRREYAARGQGRLFDRLKPFLTGDQDAGAYRELADELSAAGGTLRVAVHRMRTRYGRALRERIAQTVEDPAEVEEEIQYLLSVVARG